MVSAVPAGGRLRKQVRSVGRTVRERRPKPHGRKGDAELLALVEEPYSDVSEVNQRLQELLSAFETRDDRRAVFLSIYTRMTDAVSQQIRENGFEDPDWMADYLVGFANLYRAAVYDYEHGDLSSLADPWQLAFEATEDNDSLVLQDAMLGVNAHINYDLALAVDEVGVGPDRTERYEDHSRVTDIISDIINDAQDLLIEHGGDRLETLHDLPGRLDEFASVLTIDQCRDSAWRTAVALNSRYRTRRKLARWINDVTSTGAAYLILSTRMNDRLHQTLADLESGPEADGAR